MALYFGLRLSVALCFGLRLRLSVASMIATGPKSSPSAKYSHLSDSFPLFSKDTDIAAFAKLSGF